MGTAPGASLFTPARAFSLALPPPASVAFVGYSSWSVDAADGFSGRQGISGTATPNMWTEGPWSGSQWLPVALDGFSVASQTLTRVGCGGADAADQATPPKQLQTIIHLHPDVDASLRGAAYPMRLSP